MEAKSQERIETATELVASGDYRKARKIALSLVKAQASGDNETREARHILAVTGVDPAAALAFAITFGILLFLALVFVY